MIISSVGKLAGFYLPVIVMIVVCIGGKAQLALCVPHISVQVYKGTCF